MSGTPTLTPILTRLRHLASDRSRSTIKLMIAGAAGILVLATFLMTGTFTAMNLIDEAAVATERQRAILALETVLADEAAAPDAETARRIARTYLLADARIASPQGLHPGEISVPIPGSASVLAWVPRRFATETFEAVAPMRLVFSAMMTAVIGFILLRLHAVARDLEARRVLAQEVASRDALTGLKNRLTFDQELREAFAHGVNAERPLTLFYLDLDAFKSVNDTLGHMAGDDLLRMTGERLSAAVDPADSVARLGGDEFAVLRHGKADRGTLITLAVRIRTALSAPFPLDGTLATIGVSIGIAAAPEMAGDPESLVRAADVALYRAKAEGDTHYAFAQGGVRGPGRRTAA